MNYSIIGMGFICSRHEQAIRDTGGQVIMKCDVDESRNPDFTDYKEMFKSDMFKKEVEAVVINTPNHLHKQMIKDALATGKKVLCEKPLILDDDFSGLDGVNTVLQLRHHKLIPEIKKSLTGNDRIELIMKVYRDEKWWNSWRGNENQSGGILMGLAIHMFDFLIFLLGNEYRVVESFNSKDKCTGIIYFNNTLVQYDVEVLPTREGQTRKFIINGEPFELCDKDNLSFAGYHDVVHREFQKGNGIPLTEARKSIELILELKKEHL